MRIRLEGLPQRYHEDHIAAKGINSLSHYNLVHKFIPMPDAMKFPDAKAAVDKEWENLEMLPSCYSTKVKKQKRSYSGTQKEKRSPFCYADGHLSSQNCGVGAEAANVQSPGCAPK